ncbi:hypothetical protein [Listeria ivanovii]|nr:hypothetical protein [Listeria ivanovii]
MILKKIFVDSKIELGLPVRDSRVEKADEAISNWLIAYKVNGGNENDKI